MTERLLAAEKLRGRRHESPDSALILAAKHGDEAGFAAVLAAAGERARSDVTSWHEVLAGALEGGHADLARRIVELGEARGHTLHELLSGIRAPLAGRTTELFRRELFNQISRGHTEIVRWMTKLDPSALSQPHDGRLAIVEAARAGHADLVACCLDRGIAPDAIDENKETALLAAAAGNHATVMRLLLDAGATTGIAPGTTQSALHVAAGHSALAAIKLLLKRKADPNLPDEWLLKPLDHALLASAGDAARLLIEHGARFSPTAPSAPTMIECAIIHDLADPLEDALAAGWPAGSALAGVWPAARVAQLHGATSCLERLAPPPASGIAAIPVIDADELDRPLQVQSSPDPKDPRHPAEFFPAHEVVLRCVVDAAGRVLFPRVVHADDCRLIPAAVRAAWARRFEPPLRAGHPVAVMTELSIRFHASPERVFAEHDGIRNATLRRIPSAHKPTHLRTRDFSDILISVTIDSSGYPVVLAFEDPPPSSPDLRASALLAVTRARFNPARLDGLPVPERQTVRFNYRSITPRR